MVRVMIFEFAIIGSTKYNIISLGAFYSLCQYTISYHSVRSILYLAFVAGLAVIW